MDTAMPEEKLREVFDRITREVTQDAVGIHLEMGGAAPGDDLCTVHIGFKKGFHSSLSLRADTSMLARLTQSILHKENVTPQDLEDVAKEYFNVLCGHIASALYQATRVASRFDVPSFHRGSFAPQGQREQFILSYADDRDNSAQLIHHVPNRAEREDWVQFSYQHERGGYMMKKRVMVVDDSRIQELQIRNLLKDTDYEVVAYCRNGEEALDSYGKVTPDVVTMDIIMPGMDGLETTRALLEDYPEAKVVMVSSLAYDETYDEAQELGAKGFLSKPFSQKQLLETLDRALAG